jgi:hypothetical protein
LTREDLLCGRCCQALFMTCPIACPEIPKGRPNGSVSLDRCWWLRDPWSARAPNDRLSVVTSRGHAPAPAGALGACEARGGPLLLIIGSSCDPGPRNELPTPQSKTVVPFLGLWGLSETAEPDPAALRTAPAGRSPVFRKRQRASSNVRARATSPIFRRRPLPWPNRLCYPCVRRRSG